MDVKFRNLIFVASLAIIAFLAGMWWQRQRYLDICLDMGGGLNPGGYPICVLEKEKSDNNAKVVSAAFQYDCSGKGTVVATIINNTFATVTLSQSQKEDITFDAILSPSGSGAKYIASDSELVFWEQDGECMIIDGDSTIYQGCKLIK